MTTETADEARTVTDVDLTATLLNLIGATSVSPAVEPAAKALSTLLTSSGFEVSVDDWGNVIGRLDFGPGPVVLYDAHIDTVEVGDRSRWRHDPVGELVGDLIVGRGAVDTKGPLVAAVHAARQLATGSDVTGSLIISGSVDEELAEGPSLGRILDQVTPDVVVIGEPSDNVLSIGQRGRGEVVVDITGASSHSAFPESGVNAVDVMAESLLALRDMPLLTDPNLGVGQLTLVSIQSSPYPSQSTVPAGCVAVFDRRTVVGETEDEVLAEIRAVVEPIAHRHGAGAVVRLARASWRTWRGHEVDAPVFAPAWHQVADSWPVRAVVPALDGRGFDSRTTTWQFCTHGSESAGRRGIPTIGYGPGRPDVAHTADEAISLSELRQGVDGYHAIFTALLGSS
ncbi:M20/M25/M40 family metallo-hydrolase [Rhodococcus sp. T7]|uniref:M20/M25/M40 family metallo-hydrolase n=1 Tax=Rhodococcus sp. T7 TaxID=627444 RepID=UPI0013575F2C|nr:M20/M25/M40 family metallo-hydrolase [Rhodococcus sp. T7]KAF0964474.1 Acetylornithine deacetylase [Rhodococcus sp. T7]